MRCESRSRSRRRGFALMTVLWVMLAVAVLALGGATTTREAIGLSANRVESERALWLARACFETARSEIDAALWSARRDDDVLRAWRSLDRLVRVRGNACDVELRVAGSRLDVNGADSTQLRKVLEDSRVADAAAVTTAIIRYRERHGFIADIAELQRALAGSADTSALLDIPIDVEPGRISLNNAPAAVLRTVPGFTDDIVTRIVIDRETGGQVTDIAALSASAPLSARDSMLAHFPDIVRLTTVNPDAWVVRAQGWSGSPRATVIFEGRLVLDGSSATVVRVRSW